VVVSEELCICVCELDNYILSLDLALGLKALGIGFVLEEANLDTSMLKRNKTI